MTILSKRSAEFVALVAAMFALAFLFTAVPAHANPSQTPPTKSLNNTASTTQVYISGGFATSTITYDSFSVGSDTKFDQVNVAMQIHSSSSPATLKFRMEDSPDGINWYPRSVVITTATTTQITGSFNEYQIPVATSTASLGGSGVASSSVLGITARVHQNVVVDTTMRWARAIFYVQPGGGPVALWAQLIPVKEKQ